jgi:plasmid stabilization system protein ParE
MLLGRGRDQERQEVQTQLRFRLHKPFEMISDLPLIGNDQGQIKKTIRLHVHEFHFITFEMVNKNWTPFQAIFL